MAPSMAERKGIHEIIPETEDDWVWAGTPVFMRVCLVLFGPIHRQYLLYVYLWERQEYLCRVPELYQRAEQRGVPACGV